MTSVILHFGFKKVHFYRILNCDHYNNFVSVLLWDIKCLRPTADLRADVWRLSSSRRWNTCV